MRKRTLNLLPPSKARPFLKTKTALIAFAVVVIYIAFIGGLRLINSYEHDKLNRTIGELNGRKLELARLISGAPPVKVVPGEAAREKIMNAMRETPPWEAILSEISVVVPDNIWLEVIESTDARHMRLKGYSRTQSGIARLIADLERSGYFENVEIVYSQKGENAISFELRVEMTWA